MFSSSHMLARDHTSDQTALPSWHRSGIVLTHNSAGLEDMGLFGCSAEGEEQRKATQKGHGALPASANTSSSVKERENANLLIWSFPIHQRDLAIREWVWQTAIVLWCCLRLNTDYSCRFKLFKYMAFRSQSRVAENSLNLKQEYTSVLP